MRIAEVIGRVTLARLHPSFKGARFVIALPMPREALASGSAARGEEVVVFDNLGASPGALFALSEGAEATAPFGKARIPIDAYCAALLDRVSVDPG